ILDFHQAGKQARDFIYAVIGWLRGFRCHRGHFRFSRYFWGFEEILSIIFLASKSNLTVSPYQLMLPENLPFKLLLSSLNSSVWVSSLVFKADWIAPFSV